MDETDRRRKRFDRAKMVGKHLHEDVFRPWRSDEQNVSL